MNRGDLDQAHEHYRVCPECGLEFMANHSSRKFCCAQHKIKCNNRKKKREAATGSRAEPVDHFLQQLNLMGRRTIGGSELKQLSLNLGNYWLKVYTHNPRRCLLLYGNYGLEDIGQQQYAIIKIIKNE
jgi:ribosomal protein S27AE